jgi:formylmethanofuran--tetrahydromethanopterin N-formyltransferase
VFNGLPCAEEQISLGKYLRYFGDGLEEKQSSEHRTCWRIPVMDGEFLVEETAGVAKGIAGGNIILQATTPAAGLAAARRTGEALAPLAGVIAPFPGGVVRSGSKVGSRYKALTASTNDAFCPTLRDRVESHLVEGANCAYEIVIDGMDESSVAAAMKTALQAAAGEGVLAVGAGNYGGKLGKFQFHLRELLR